MRIHSNGLEIEVDDQGAPSADPLLLIMGLGMPMVAWPQELVDDLVARGFRVIRMDNRDIGLSQGLDHLGVPSLLSASLRHVFHLPVRSPYPLRAMADDALGVLDALGIRRAHVCGVSMGGMIAQHIAAHAAGRVKSLALIMTSSGARTVPGPKPAVRTALLGRPRSHDVATVVSHLEHLLHLIGSPAYRPDPQRQRERLEAMVRRAWRPQGTARQLLAIVADGDRSALLRHISAPTLVVHGEADPLIPVAAAYDLLRKIPQATADIVPGMGHDLPVALMPRLAAQIASNAARYVEVPQG